MENGRSRDGRFQFGCIPANKQTDPKKVCVVCGAVFTRKRFPGGLLENRKIFRKRRYCSRTCARVDSVAWRKGPPIGTSPWNKGKKTGLIPVNKGKSESGAPPHTSEYWRYFNLKKLYRLTPDEYERRLEQQRNLCAICGQPERTVHWKTGKIRRLAIDHDHSTRQYRALLCNRCNRVIGALGDDLSLLRKIVHYLEQHSPTQGLTRSASNGRGR